MSIKEVVGPYEWDGCTAFKLSQSKTTTQIPLTQDMNHFRNYRQGGGFLWTFSNSTTLLLPSVSLPLSTFPLQTS